MADDTKKGTESDPDKSIETFKRSRGGHLGHLTRLYTELEKCMMTHEDKDSVNEMYRSLCERFELFKKAHLKCLEMCTNPDVAETLESHFESCRQNLAEFSERLEEWRAEKKPEDGMSNISRSSTSSITKLKGAKVKRLIAEQKTTNT